MKVLPFDYTIPTAKPFWSNGGRFWRFEPDFLIALFNQLLFLAVIALVFFLARRLFDPGVAWLSAGLLLGTELFWRFSVSGLSTMLLMVIFLGLAWCVVLLEQEARAPKWGPSRHPHSGRAGRRGGRPGRADAIRVWLADHSGAGVPDPVRRAAAGRAGLDRPGGVCGRDGAVDSPQLLASAADPSARPPTRSWKPPCSTPKTAWSARWSRTSAAST